MIWFKDVDDLAAADRRGFDAITTESNSYFTKEHEILAPVGAQNVALPALPRRLRTSGKSSLRTLARRHNAGARDVRREGDKRHIAELRNDFRIHENSVSAQQVLENTPADLRRRVESAGFPGRLQLRAPTGRLAPRRYPGQLLPPSASVSLNGGASAGADASMLRQILMASSLRPSCSAARPVK